MRIMDQPSTSGGERDKGSGAGACDLVGSQDILSLVFQQMAHNRKRTVLDDAASTASTSRSPTFAARDWIACRLVCKSWKEMTEVRGDSDFQWEERESVEIEGKGKMKTRVLARHMIW